MSSFTPEAMKDSRFKINPYRQSLKVHPRDWVEAWGLKEPVKWKHTSLQGKKSEEKLYPYYTKEAGWEWVPENSYKFLKLKDQNNFEASPKI